MKQLRRRTLHLTLALAMILSVMIQPASAAGSISELVERVNVITASVQDLALTEDPFALTDEELGEELDQAFDEDLDAQNGVEATAEVSEPEVSSQGVIVGGTINVRSGPGTEYERISQVSSGKLVDVLAKDSGWYQIQFDSVTGYVLGDYLRETTNDASTIGEQIVALAMPYLGTRYVRGGASGNGFDCSGFTLFLYAQFGYSLPHSATSQYNNCGSYVAKENLQPGDLVFFSDSSHAIGHVAVYIGNGQIIHARYSVGRVNIDNLSSNYYTNRYVGAKRLA